MSCAIKTPEILKIIEQFIVSIAFSHTFLKIFLFLVAPGCHKTNA